MISRRRHQRELTAARRAYREAYERETAEVRAKEARVTELLDSLIHARLDRLQRNHPSDGLIHLRLALDVSPQLLQHMDIYEIVARRVVEGLAGLRDDHRPDLRAADKPALLAPY